MGSNDTSDVVWAIGTSLFYLSLNLLIPANVLLIK
jgi:hypothetical protein